MRDLEGLRAAAQQALAAAGADAGWARRDEVDVDTPSDDDG